MASYSTTKLISEQAHLLVELGQLVGRLAALPMPPPGAPGPFAQSDPAIVEPLLAAAGWSDVACQALDQPIWLGHDADQGATWQLGQSAWLLLGTDESQRATAAANLRALFAAHQTPAGVLLGSAAWLTTARRAL